MRFSSSSDDGLRRAVFNRKTEEYKDEQGDVLVFTPFIQYNWRQSNTSPKYAIAMWIVSRTGEYYKGVEVLVCVKKVEGLCNLDKLEARRFILC